MTIDVLGLGESLSEYRGGNISFGVNDIFRYVPVNFLVVLDVPSKFTPERLSVIENSTPEAFYAHKEEWSYHPNYVPIKLQHGQPDISIDMDSPLIPHSKFSPFVAVIMAYKYFHADRIELYGVDMTSHKVLSQDNIALQIKQHWGVLTNELNIRGCEVVVHGKGLLVK